MDICSKIAGQILLEELQSDPNKNILVSPLSFNAILNMITAGSSGPTLEQMLEFLKLRNIKDVNSQFEEFMAKSTTKDNERKRKRGNQEAKEGPLLCFINGVWISELFKLKDSYNTIVKTIYNAEARCVDFSKPNEVVKETNAWAKSASKGLVTNVLQPSDITKDTILILGNSLYFKGSWDKPFDCKRPKNKDFYLLNGGKTNVPFMTSSCKYRYGSFKGIKVVQIPYETGEDMKRQFSMYIFLPNKRDGLHSLLKIVNSDSKFLAKHSQLERRAFDKFWIPKFKFAYCTDKAVKTMKNMGLTLPFEKECKDLTEMISIPNGESVYVSNITQKCFIEIDEKGTEAVAVTFSSGRGGCAMGYRQTPITFVADHPFLFTIMEENSGLILFTGAVLNPLLE